MIITWFGIILSLVSILITVIGVRRINKSNRDLKRRLRRLINSENRPSDDLDMMDASTFEKNTYVLFRIAHFPVSEVYIVEAFITAGSQTAHYITVDEESGFHNITGILQYATNFKTADLAKKAIGIYREQHYKNGVYYVEQVL